MIAIIDYGMGNVRSVFNALSYIGEDPVITKSESKIKDATHIILPGVGSFGNAMENLKNRGLVELLNKEVVKKGKPFLGICLGAQLLTKRSFEHGVFEGFGWVDAEVKEFEFNGETNLKLPHVGWNNIILKKDHPFFANLEDGQRTFYFVHSYHIRCQDESTIAATCEYGYPFTAALAKDNIVATQFHPEKSQDNGVQLLENFVEWKS